MKNFSGSFLLFFLIVFASQSFPQAKISAYHKWWDDSFPGKQYKSKNAKLLPLIMVKGNKFVSEKNDTLLFRGLSIADPDKIEHEGQWNKELFVRIKKLGTMVVRIPIHPIAWRERTVPEYLKLLDQAVDWAAEAGLYLDIDWHSIGNLQTDLYQDPMYNTTKAETFNFWRVIAEHFSGNNTVAFLELYNEPTIYRGQLGPASWDEWKKINENLITMIRAYNNKAIPLVAGFDWAYDLTPLAFAPINAQEIGYITHPYPHKRNPPYEPKWEEDFGFAANTYPVIASEIGFTLGAGSIAENGTYGKAIINYLEAKGISWIWWVYDPQWTPCMIESWDTFKLTECGSFYEAAANGKAGK